jgi:hypothetical protein
MDPEEYSDAESEVDPVPGKPLLSWVCVTSHMGQQPWFLHSAHQQDMAQVVELLRRLRSENVELKKNFERVSCVQGPIKHVSCTHIHLMQASTCFLPAAKGPSPPAGRLIQAAAGQVCCIVRGAGKPPIVTFGRAWYPR